MRALRIAALRLVAIALLALGVTAPTPALAQSSSTPGTAPPFLMDLRRVDGPITLDGRIDEAAWEQATRIDVPVRLYQPAPDPENLSAEVRAFWNDAGLWVAAAITDDTLLFTDNVRDLGEYDSFSVWVNHFWIQASPAEGAPALLRYRYLQGFPPKPFEARAAAVKGESGYTVEVFVPAATVTEATGTAFGPGATIPLAFTVTDRDDPETRGRAILYFPARFGWNSPASMAQTTLR